MRSVLAAIATLLLTMSSIVPAVAADDAGAHVTAAADDGDKHAAPVSVQEHIKRFARDGAYLAAAPLRLDSSDILPLVVVGGTIGVTIAYDGHLQDRFAGLRRWGGASDLATAGDVLQFGGLIGGAGLYAYGRAAGDEHAIDHAWTQADGTLWAFAATEALKYTIGRERPDGGRPHAFHPFSGNTSLPSGHTVPAFTAATIAVEEHLTLSTAIPLFALGIVIGHILERVHARPSSDWSLDVDRGMVRFVHRF